MTFALGHPTASALSALEGSGSQAIVGPLFSTKPGIDTLFRLSHGSRTSAITAVRVQFRHSDGTAVKRLNLYLLPGQSWEVAATSVGGISTLTLDTGKCVFQDQPDTGIQLVTSPIEIGSELGYLEVLSMGEINDTSILAEVINGGCDVVIDFFETGIWSEDPNTGIVSARNSLRLTSQLINVAKGTIYDIAGFGISDFREFPSHVEPATEFGLADAQTFALPTGAFSTICADECQTLAWPDPRDAVSSVMLMTNTEVDYNVNAALSASTAFIALNPMAPYYEPSRFDGFLTGTFITDSDAGLLNVFLPCQPLPLDPLDSCPPPLRVSRPDPLRLFSFGPADNSISEPIQIPIVGAEGENPLFENFVSDTGLQALKSGTLSLVVGQEEGTAFQADGGEHLFGMPLIFLALTEYQNGTLTTANGELVRANYGSVSYGRSINEQ